ncbi:Chemotaxis Precursor (Motility Protein C) Transmembrane [Liberibacter crescens BT-1]|uniref:Chemotaxis (Motility Protein C) Transmembrane n=2 Tax=Liberibacter crescens TaxID=1273132 RepID=L0EVF5_LIBCB|nr:Chemotaxis Precursor (Motility Protein C) Transmembrane [Liberibacter crescens BT-1]
MMIDKEIIFFAILTIGILVPEFAIGYEADNVLPPYRLIRSLQTVMDTAIQGNVNIRSSMIKDMDIQLRKTNIDAFSDQRNVEAVLIYSMIGGNPLTLEYFLSKDTKGYFDTSFIKFLRQYLSGTARLNNVQIQKLQKEIDGRPIVPYMALLFGNMMMVSHSSRSLQFFDQVRLLSPGTILEEIALRRSLAVAIRKGMQKNAIRYAKQYVRRFSHSTYFEHFARLLIQLFISDTIKIEKNDILEITSFLSPVQKYNIFFKIARYAIISNKRSLGIIATEQLKALVNLSDHSSSTIRLYEELVKLPFSDIRSIEHNLESISDKDLSSQDRSLKMAAKFLIKEILRSPLIDFYEIRGNNSYYNGISKKDLGVVSEQKNIQSKDVNFSSFIIESRNKLDALDQMLGENRRL